MNERKGYTQRLGRQLAGGLILGLLCALCAPSAFAQGRGGRGSRGGDQSGRRGRGGQDVTRTFRMNQGTTDSVIQFGGMGGGGMGGGAMRMMGNMDQAQIQELISRFQNNMNNARGGGDNQLIQLQGGAQGLDAIAERMRQEREDAMTRQSGGRMNFGTMGRGGGRGDRATTTVLNPSRTQEGITLNFQGAPLSDVLDYLSRAAGLTIVPLADINGTVELVSHVPVTKEEAIDLLNFSLANQGLTAILDNRLLKIVTVQEAPLHKLPVRKATRPEDIPNNETWATWVIPFQYATASSMEGEFRELMPDFAKLMVDSSANSFIITDTQSRSRRIAEIMQMLDDSIVDSTVSAFFPIKYAYAEDIAYLVQDVFANRAMGGGSTNRNRNQRGGGGRGNTRGGSGQVTAVPDYRTNIVIVNAPEELMPEIEDLIIKVDTPAEDVSQVRIFELRYASAEDTANLVLDMFNTSQYNQRGRGNQGRGGGRNQRGGGGGFGNPFQTMFGFGQQGLGGQRTMRDEQVYAVADLRTNFVVVKAASTIMPQIEKMILEVDNNPIGDQGVFVFDVGAWNVVQVSELLDQMFSDNRQGGGNVRRNTGRGGGNRGNRNTQRGGGGQRGGGQRGGGGR